MRRFFLALASAASTANFTNSSLKPSQRVGSLARVTSCPISERGSRALCCSSKADTSGGLAVVAGRLPICRSFLREPPIHASMLYNVADKIVRTSTRTRRERISERYQLTSGEALGVQMQSRASCCVL